MALTAACGRAGFALRDAAVDTVVEPDAAPDTPAPQQLLACGAPVRFSITGTPQHLAATGTLDGYDVFAVEDGVVRGDSYQFAGDRTSNTLVAAHSDVVVADNAAATLGAVALGDDVLVAMPYASTDGAGTAVIPLDRELVSRGTPTKRDGAFAASGSIASSAGGHLALLSQDLDLGPGGGAAVSAQLISPLGADVVAAAIPVEVVSADEHPNNPTITPGRSGFVVTWTATARSPHQVFARVLDEMGQPDVATTLISVQLEFTPTAPRAAYAAAADRFLFAWYQKVNNIDQIWASLRDGNLAPIGDPILVSSQGIFPVVAAGDRDFLVVWSDGGQPAHLGAARIAIDGTRTPLGIAASGGSLGDWDLTVRHGQSALVWSEVGGSGPNLWIDPLCDR